MIWPLLKTDLNFSMTQDIMFKCKVLVSRHSSKKNEKRAIFDHGRTFLTKSKKAKVSENFLKQRLIIEKLKQRLETITCDLNAKYTFYFPETIYFTKKGERSKKLPDISNLFELPSDVMQSINIIHNDTQICSFDGSRRLPSDDGKYWLEIELTKI